MNMDPNDGCRGRIRTFKGRLALYKGFSRDPHPRRPYSEIAADLKVSPGTVHVRMKRLIRRGVVTGSTINLDLSRLGYDLIAFLGIYLEKGSAYNNVIRSLKKVPEVVEAYYTTGEYSIFARIVCSNTEHMRHVLNDRIQSIRGIERTETMVSLEERIKRNVDLDHR